MEREQLNPHAEVARRMLKLDLEAIAETGDGAIETLDAAAPVLIATIETVREKFAAVGKEPTLDVVECFLRERDTQYLAQTFKASLEG